MTKRDWVIFITYTITVLVISAFMLLGCAPRQARVGDGECLVLHEPDSVFVVGKGCEIKKVNK